MAFQNDTNAGRVEKMIDTLRLIEKSATANRASPAEIASLIAPLLTALTPYLPSEAAASSQPTGTAKDHLTAGERAGLLLADGASLRQLVAALIGRLDAMEHRLTDDAGDAP